MVVAAHFVAHSHVRDTENSHADEENDRPCEEVPKIIELAVLRRELPHCYVGEASNDSADENERASFTPPGLEAIGDVPHKRVSQRVHEFREEENQSP